MRTVAPPSLSTVLTTERLTLRACAANQAGAMCAALRKNRRHLEPWTPLATADYFTLTSTSERIARWRSEWRKGCGFNFHVYEKKQTSIVGHVALTGIARGVLENAYLGYWIDGESQGRGYAGEAAAAALEFGFGVLKLHRIQASVMPRNARSIRVAERLGFRNEGTALRYLKIHGHWEDHLIFAMTHEEWTEKAQRAT